MSDMPPAGWAVKLKPHDGVYRTSDDGPSIPILSSRSNTERQDI
jgi:hypothetical protein